MSKKDLATFTKEQFLSSKNFAGLEKDLLQALLKDGESYTTDQAKKIMDDFKQRKVN